MTLTTRTEWVKTTAVIAGETDIAGFGPVTQIRCDEGDGPVTFVNVHGCSRRYPVSSHVEVLLGTFNEEGRRISMSTPDYIAQCRREAAAEAAVRQGTATDEQRQIVRDVRLATW